MRCLPGMTSMLAFLWYPIFLQKKSVASVTGAPTYSTYREGHLGIRAGVPTPALMMVTNTSYLVEHFHESMAYSSPCLKPHEGNLTGLYLVYAVQYAFQELPQDYTVTPVLYPFWVYHGHGYYRWHVPFHMVDHNPVGCQGKDHSLLLLVSVKHPNPSDPCQKLATTSANHRLAIMVNVCSPHAKDSILTCPVGLQADVQNNPPELAVSASKVEPSHFVRCCRPETPSHLNFWCHGGSIHGQPKLVP